VVDDDGLPLAVDIEGFGARLAKAVAGILDAAKRHVRPGAVGRPVDRDQAGAIARDELLDAIAVARVNRPGEAVGGVVRELDRLLEARHPVQTGHWTELLLLR